MTIKTELGFVDLSPPRTPLKDGLTAAAAFTYSRLSPGEVAEQTISRSLNNNEPQALLMIGPPGSGKTALLSELLALAEYRFRVMYHDRGLEKDDFTDRIFHLAYESAQTVSVEQGIVKSKVGQQTPEDYERVNNIFGRAVARALDNRMQKSALKSTHEVAPKGRIVFVEVPGTVGRGTSTIINLARRKGVFEHLRFGLCCIMLVAGREVSETSFMIRQGYAQTPSDKLSVLERFGVNVHVTDPEKARVGGGVIGAVLRYYDQENLYFADLQKSSQIRLPKFPIDIYDPQILRMFPSLRRQYVEECFAPFLLRDTLFLPPGSVSFSKNNLPCQVEWYQDHLDRYNLIEALRRSNQTHLILP